MPLRRPSLCATLFWIAGALLISGFCAQAELTGHASHAVFSTIFRLEAVSYVALFVSYVFLPEPVNRRFWLPFVFWPVLALMICCLFSPMILSGSGPLVGTFVLGIGPICHVLVLSIASLMPQSRRFFRSPAFLAGVLLAVNPIWVLPLLNAARKFEGENYMGQLIYWLFYLPLGVFTVAADFARRQRRTRQEPGTIELSRGGADSG